MSIDCLPYKYNVYIYIVTEADFILSVDIIYKSRYG